MPRASFQIVKSSEWREYRNIRLAALSDAPDAFGSTFENANAYPDQEWENRCKEINLLTDYPLVAIIDGVFVGLVWAKIDHPAGAICNIYQMWVNPKYRGLSLGRKLVVESLNWASSNNIKSIQLSVTCGNSPAQNLYESLGFIAIGNPEPIRKDSSTMVQQMELILSDDST